MKNSIAVKVFVEICNLIGIVVSFSAAPIFYIVHALLHSTSLDGQYFVYRPMRLYLDNKLQWVFWVHVYRELHEFGSTSETYDFWYTYSSI